MEKYIFISYRHKCATKDARLIASELRQNGWDVRMDEDHAKTLPYGEPFPSRLKATIENALYVLLLLTPNTLTDCYKDKDWVAEEMLIAKEANKKIIPVILNGKKKFKFPNLFPERLNFLKDLQQFPFYLSEFNDSIRRLSENLGMSNRTGKNSLPIENQKIRTRAAEKVDKRKPIAGCISNGIKKSEAKLSESSIIPGDAPGEWEPMPGYQWINDVPDDLTTKWVEGIAHPNFKHITSSSAEGYWRSDLGYCFLNNTPGDFNVRKGVHNGLVSLEAVSKAFKRIKSTNLFLGKKIPLNSRTGARLKFQIDESKTPILALYDSAIIFKGREGYVITTVGVHFCKSSLLGGEEVHFLPWGKIQIVDGESSEDEIFINKIQGGLIYDGKTTVKKIASAIIQLARIAQTTCTNRCCIKASM